MGPSDPVYAVEYGRPGQIVLLVYARTGRPEHVVLQPRTLDPTRRYRLFGTGREIDGAEAAAGLDVSFALAPDADVLVLEAVS